MDPHDTVAFPPCRLMKTRRKKSITHTRSFAKVPFIFPCCGFSFCTLNPACSAPCPSTLLISSRTGFALLP